MFTDKFFSLFDLRPNMVFFGHFVPSRSVNTYIHTYHVITNEETGGPQTFLKSNVLVTPMWILLQTHNHKPVHVRTALLCPFRHEMLRNGCDNLRAEKCFSSLTSGHLWLYRPARIRCTDQSDTTM